MKLSCDKDINNRSYIHNLAVAKIKREQKVRPVSEEDPSVDSYPLEI